MRSVACSAWTKALERVRLDKDRQPRLKKVVEGVFGVAIRLMLGGGAQNLRVQVEASSNRQIAMGRIAGLNAEWDSVNSVLLQAGSGSIKSVGSWDLGLLPAIFVGFPLSVLFGFGFFWSILLSAALLLAAPVKPFSASYTILFSQSDLNTGALKLLLTASLDAIMRNSLLGAAVAAAAGDLQGTLQSATGFKVRSADIDGRKLVFNSDAELPDGSLFSFTLRSSLQGGGNGELTFPDPELFVSPGWPLPDFWLPVFSAVALDLGSTIRIAQVESRQGSLAVSGVLVFGKAPEDWRGGVEDGGVGFWRGGRKSLPGGR